MKQGVAVVRPKMSLPEFVKTNEQACHEKDTEIFYPPKYNKESTAPAKKICQSCKFIQECGTWAILVGEPEGVWGSLSPGERREIRLELGLSG